MRTKNVILVSLSILVIALLAVSGVAYARSFEQDATTTPPMRTLNVNGTGKAYLTPDIAYISVGVHTEGKDAAEAVASNNTLSEKVLSALKAAGIAEKDLQTTNFSITPQQQYDTNGQPTGEITYLVNNTVYVTMRDISKVGEVLDTAVKAGANNVYGIEFDATNKDAALKEARQQAVQNAVAAAQDLAEASGVALGALQTISSYGGTPVPMYESKGVGGANYAMDASVSVTPGQMVLSVEVSLIYEIR